MADPHQLELANTLLSIGAFLVIFLAARVLGELMVRLQLPTILGELLGGVVIFGILSTTTTVGARGTAPPRPYQEMNREFLSRNGEKG